MRPNVTSSALLFSRWWPPPPYSLGAWFGLYTLPDLVVLSSPMGISMGAGRSGTSIGSGMFGGLGGGDGGICAGSAASSCRTPMGLFCTGLPSSSSKFTSVVGLLAGVAREASTLARAALHSGPLGGG